jgi:hypothetical protein
MRHLYHESSGNEIFALEEGDAETLFPLYAKEPLIFSSDPPTVQEAVLAQMGLNRVAWMAYFEHLQEKGKGVYSEEAQHRLRQMEHSMRSISFYLSGRLEDIMDGQ